ncbi:MAG: phosphomethylpyrimidine synthase ThiC [Halobacteriota archaeon]
MTLMTDAQKGLTGDILKIAQDESVEPDKLRRLIASGRAVLLKSVNHTHKPLGIGESLSAKVNANVGTSVEYVDKDDEVLKAHVALQFGADTVMDLSTGGELDDIRGAILQEVHAPIGTVPIYQAAMSRGAVVQMTSDDMFNTVRKHAEDGVSFMTIHAGVTLNSLQRLKNSRRIMGVVSRGGAFTIAWMVYNEQDNPFYTEYDYLLEMAEEYDFTISLGDGMRSGCLHDASDRPKFMEYVLLGELVQRAREKGVQTIVEGPGHVPLNEIESNVRAMKSLTNGAPLYLLGPLVTDIAPGYDHITGAIGGALAGMYGTDFLCMTTPSEHLGLPTTDDIKQGAVVTKLAAHVADLARSRGDALKWDNAMATARASLDWKRQFELSIDPDYAQQKFSCRTTSTEACSMCGDLCAIRIVRDALNSVDKAVPKSLRC